MYNLRACRRTRNVKKNAPGISNWKRPGFCPWSVIGAVYYATPFVYVWNSGLGPRVFLRALGVFNSSSVRSLIGELSLEAAESEVNPIAVLPDLGLPGLPLPSLQRVYIHFCEPVDTSQFESLAEEGDTELVAAVHGAVESGVQRLMKTREEDPERGLQERLLAKMSGFVPQTSRLMASYGNMVDGVMQNLTPPGKQKR
eukprot:9499059-Pyramimonas_sp.AAC.1